jgi:hypothetical protein
MRREKSEKMMGERVGYRRRGRSTLPHHFFRFFTMAFTNDLHPVN